MSSDILIRRADPSDAEGIAAAWIAAFGETYAFPSAHTSDEVRAWVASGLLPTTDMWVAVSGERVVGFMALRGSSVEQLYLRQPWTGAGIGSRLMAIAKEERPGGLELWTFQVNVGARRFYERHGFVAAELTDGAGNEEHQPDVRYVWKGVGGRG